MGYTFPPQKILAQEYQVGASTIREAMTRLSMLGYITSKQGVGTRVAGNSSAGQLSNLGQYVFLESSEVPQFMEARLSLEKTAVKSAAMLATKDDLVKIAECLKLQAVAVKKGDPELFSNYDKLFHLRIMEAGRNPILVQFMNVIQSALFSWIEEATRLERVMANSLVFHEKIFGLIEKNDGAKAEKLLVAHLWDVASIIDASLGLNEDMKNLFRREGLTIA